MTEEEFLNILNFLKDNDVKIGDLLVKVYNLETKKEGWISVKEALIKIKKELEEKNE